MGGIYESIATHDNTHKSSPPAPSSAKEVAGPSAIAHLCHNCWWPRYNSPHRPSSAVVWPAEILGKDVIQRKLAHTLYFDDLWCWLYIWLYIYHNLSISLGTRMYRMSKRTWSWKKNMDVLQPVEAFPASKRTNAICHSPPFSHALMAAQQVTSSAHWSLLLVFHWNQGISSPSKYIKTWADVFQSTERVDDSQYKHALHASIFLPPKSFGFPVNFPVGFKPVRGFLQASHVIGLKVKLLPETKWHQVVGGLKRPHP